MGQTQTELDKVLEDAGDKLVVVDFTASWCPPCKRIAPVFAKLDEENADVVFVKVDVDENSETSEKYGIQAMPTFIFLKKKEKVDTLQGADEDKLKEMISKHKES